MKEEKKYICGMADSEKCSNCKHMKPHGRIYGCLGIGICRGRYDCFCIEYREYNTELLDDGLFEI